MQNYRPGSTSSAGVWRDRVRIAPALVPMTGRAVRDGLGIGHAVTFEMRGEDEHVGFPYQRREALRRYGAEHCHSISDCVTRDIGVKLRGGAAVARAVAGNRQPPRQIGERRPSAAISTSKPLRGTIAPDRQQTHDAVLAALRHQRRIAARPCHGNALGRHAVIGSDQPCRRRAGDDDTLHGCERRPAPLARNASACLTDNPHSSASG